MNNGLAALIIALVAIGISLAAIGFTAAIYEHPIHITTTR